jgi:DNA-binding NarL/FixJ family response regulator
MRIVLVGDPAQRARLRRDAAGRFDVVAEAGSLSSARRLGGDVDAFLVAAAVEDDAPPVEALTPRESEVLSLVADGLSNKAIAGRLGVSDETVKFHLASIFGKLAASNRTDAVRIALRRGLIPL